MVYCMSDIHGEYERFREMLEKICFSEEDRLFLLGDLIDRGPDSVDLVLDVMSRKNVVFLLGNHEELCLDDLVRHAYDARQRWAWNRGGETRRDLLYRREEHVREAVLKYFEEAEVQLDTEVGGRKFRLVHGYPGETREECLWERPDPDAPPPIPGTTVIVGHTPTVLLTGKEDEPFRIWYGNGLIDIDCGCASRSPNKRLGCLRLDDMKEFYV